jgi:UrcA family protein
MNTKRAFRRIAVLLATVGAIGLTAVAYAGGGDDDIPKQVVKFGDLNLSSSAGAATLYRRIQRAAESVCEGPLGVRELSIAVRSNVCIAQAIERAVKDVNTQMLTSLHLAKTGQAQKAIRLASGP